MSLNQNKLAKKMEDIEKSRISTSVRTQEVNVKQYSWPIPDADDLAKYESIEKWFAARIIAMSEYRIKHATEMESKNIELNWEYMRRSMYAHTLWVIFWWFIGLSCIAVSAFAISVWAEWQWTILGVWWLWWLVSTFVYWTRMQDTENTNKKEKALSKAE